MTQKCVLGRVQAEVTASKHFLNLREKELLTGAVEPIYFTKRIQGISSLHTKKH